MIIMPANVNNKYIQIAFTGVKKGSKIFITPSFYTNNKALIIFQQAYKSPALFARFDRILLSHETSRCQVTS